MALYKYVYDYDYNNVEEIKQWLAELGKAAAVFLFPGFAR